MNIYVISTAQRYRGHDYWNVRVSCKKFADALDTMQRYMEFDGKYADYSKFITTDKKHIETFDEDANYTKAYGELFGGTGRDSGEAAFKYKIEEIYLA